MNDQEAVFYYRNDRRQEGGFSEDDFIQMIKNREILPEYEIWIFGMKEWVALKDSVYAFYLPKTVELEIKEVE